MTKPDLSNDKTVLEGKIYAVLAYLGILCIIPLVLKKDNEFVLFHSKQGLVIFIAEVAVFILGIVFDWVYRPAMFVLGVISFYGIVQALQGQYVKLPIISDIANRISL